MTKICNEAVLLLTHNLCSERKKNTFFEKCVIFTHVKITVYYVDVLVWICLIIFLMTCSVCSYYLFIFPRYLTSILQQYLYFLYENGQLFKYNMSRIMRKPPFCICENKDADQLRGNREADQRLCFHYIDSTIPLLPKSKISSL